MPDRACQTCKHFEPATVRDKGWCRNPLLYAPQQSHLVEQNTLDCARRYGNFWEPASGVAVDDGGTDESGEALRSRVRLRLFQPPPQLIAAPAGAIARNMGGGDDTISNRDSQRPAGNRAGGGGGGGQGNEGLPPGGSRVNRTGLPQGQERTVSYQPEERYWTDYLRIALPVVGLLLMLGLFWYWASAVIGNDDNNPPAQPTNVAALVTEPAPTPTATTQAVIPVQTATVAPTQTDGNQQAANPTQASATETSAPTDETTPAGGPGGYKAGDIAVTNDSANLRKDPSIDGDVVTTLDPGVELEVLDPPVEADNYQWLHVRVTDTGEEGYIADVLVDKSS
jgi:hypothetical protein